MKVTCIKDGKRVYGGQTFTVEKGKEYDVITYHPTSEFSGEFLVYFPENLVGTGNLSCGFDANLFREVSNNVTLSNMDCYAGKWLANAQAHSPDIFDKPGVYLQFIEGCGYSPYTMSPDEADEVADRLKKAAAESRRLFAEKAKAK